MLKKYSLMIVMIFVFGVHVSIGQSLTYNEIKKDARYASLLPALEKLHEERIGREPENLYNFAKFAPSDRFTFGYSIDIDGDTAVVGAPIQYTGDVNAGAAYIFVRVGGNWVQQARLTNNVGPEPNDAFGLSVAIDGNTVVIGSPGTDGRKKDTVYVYINNGSNWVLQQILVPNDEPTPLFGHGYGESVALENNRLVVGARYKSVDNIQCGAAYVYLRTGSIWSQEMRISPSDPTHGAEFGGAVSMHSERIVVGARATSSHRGAAYIFDRFPTWTERAKIVDPGGSAGDEFGRSVAIHFNLVVVGAPGDTVSGNTNRGSALIFERSGQNWPLRQKIISSIGAADEKFGSAVDVVNEVVAIGAPGTMINGEARGRAYIFALQGGTWVQNAMLWDPSASPNYYSRQGGSIAISDSSVASGSIGNGGAYIFPTAAVTQRTPFDYDGDGRADISVYRTNGTWHLARSSQGYTQVQFGIGTDKIVPADYDGDGKTDVAVFRDGTWYLQRSHQGFIAFQFGMAGDIPTPADYDGDGRAEVAIFRPDTGTWFSLNLFTVVMTVSQWGAAGDKPVPADFDGDGRADLAVYRNGVWWIVRSSGGTESRAFGIAGDRPVVGDYDGDGRIDLALVRNALIPGVGVRKHWYILGSQSGYQSTVFGIDTDVASPADFDGDGRTDIAIYRGGQWWILQTTAGLLNVAFGTGFDRPTPSAFVP
ncbi:MAG: VCBS repeat-containing protein [Chloracidobacterium sp.]|nr:VCBS repeat-containing protein [Chloracidobacterium sp.]